MLSNDALKRVSHVSKLYLVLNLVLCGVSGIHESGHDFGDHGSIWNGGCHAVDGANSTDGQLGILHDLRRTQPDAKKRRMSRSSENKVEDEPIMSKK